MNISTMNSIQHAEYLRRLASQSKLANPEYETKTAKNHPRTLALALAGIMAFAPIVNAAPLPSSEFSAYNDMEEISDGDLANMRGKFIGNNQVLYFGIDLVSQWQTPGGNLVTASATLNIDFSDDPNTPKVEYVPTISIVVKDAAPAQTGNTNTVAGGAGLTNVSGASQVIQVAGQSNSIQNGMTIKVDYTTAGQGGSINSAAQGQAGSISDTAADGTLATVTLSNNSLGVNITSPGQGEVLQQIRNQGLFQSARIGGDYNQIHNSMRMSVGMNSAVSGSNIAGASAAIESLRSLPQNNLF